MAVRDAIEDRLAGLPAGTGQVLEVAALAGNAIDADVVAMAAACSRAAVDDALAAARLAGIISVDTDDRLRFAHDLYRETIAAGIPADRVVVVHQQLGVALEARAAQGVGVHPADLAHHFTAAVPAGEASRAARWALAAAAADVESLAFGEAAAHLRRWREAARASPVAVDPREHTTVLLSEADALARAGMVEDARSRLRSAHTFTAAAPLADLRAEVALAFADLGARFAARRDEVLKGLEDALAGVEGVDPDLEARVTARLARELQHSVPADRPRASPLSERAIALGRAGAAPGTLVTCLLARHDVLWIPGRPGERIDLAREIVAIAERSGDQRRVAEGNLLLANACWRAARPHSNTPSPKASGPSTSSARPRDRYTAATRRAAVLLLRGDLEAADAAIEDAADLGSSIREPDAENVRMSQRAGAGPGPGAPRRSFATSPTPPSST